jgi:hypothetical protein
MDLAPEDDLVTCLWDAGFDHVFHQAIDSFAEGNQEQRARYEAERNQVIESAHTDPVRDAAQAWRAGQAEGGVRAHQNAAQKSKQVVDFINKSTPLDAEAAARVANMDLQGQTPEEVHAADSVRLDDSTRALLAARMGSDTAATSERFVVAAAEAFIASAKMGRSQTVTTPLRRAVDGLCAGEPEKAMDMILQLREAVQVEGKALDTENLRATLTAEILSPKTLADILRGSNELPEERSEEYLKGLTRILECIQSQHFEAAIGYLPESQPGGLRKLLIEFMRRVGRGYEPKIGALFATADVELGLELVRLLVSIESEPAREAIAMASGSPHPLVRIEALGHLEGVSGMRVRAELRKLLDDDEVEVRLAALRAMQHYQIAAAGPFLVLRIQDKAFLKLPYEEREQSLQTLSKLRPKRCEEICIALLEETKLFKMGALETTRALAARFLAEVASTDAAFHLLEGIAKSKPWSNSKEVRAAASDALDRLTARAQQELEEQKQRRASAVSMQEGARATGVKKKKKTKVGSKTGVGRPSQAPAAGTVAGAAGTDAAATVDEKSALRKKRKSEAGGVPDGTDDATRRAGGAGGE